MGRRSVILVPTVASGRSRSPLEAERVRGRGGGGGGGGRDGETARLGSGARRILERFLDEVGMQEVPFGELHWREAVDAYRRYGKGRHPAALNFGDCMTYAVASLAGEPLLFIGEDFSLTDLEPAR